MLITNMDLLAIITDIHQMKLNKNIYPDHVTEIEVINKACKSLRTELNRLVKDGLLAEVKTLNDKAYIIK